MKSSLMLLICLGFTVLVGCAAIEPGDRQAYMPLNEGVLDTSFLSPGEAEIARDVNKARESASSGSLTPLKISRGLSLAAEERARELTSRDGDKPRLDDQKRLFARVKRFGATESAVAEIVSHGYSERIVVEELMKNSEPKEELYFMDAKYNIMGVGCRSTVGGFYPICVLTFACDYKEKP